MEAVEIRRQIHEKARDLVFFDVSALWSTSSSLNINMAEKRRG